VELASTPVTSALNRVASLLPDRAWHSPPILAAMSRAAGLSLRAGRVRLTGIAPNGQRFVANPRAYGSRARVVPDCKTPTSVSSAPLPSRRN
jgi:hypothetical protein